MPRCIVTGCMEEAHTSPATGKTDKRGACSAHYQEWYRADKADQERGGRGIHFPSWAAYYATETTYVAEPVYTETPHVDDIAPATEPVLAAPAPAEPAPALGQAATDLARAILAMQTAVPAAPAIDPALEARVAALEARRDLGTRITVESVEPRSYTFAGVAHYMLPMVTAFVASGVNTLLVGPAGTGKTHLLSQAADALGLTYHCQGAVSYKLEVEGTVNVQGDYVASPLYNAYTAGNSLYVLDELDGCSANALVALAAVLANGHASFCDRAAVRGAGFRAAATANTFGHGASRQYVGRNQLDAATLDRFAVLYIDYDRALEYRLAGCHVPTHVAEQHCPPIGEPASDDRVAGYAGLVHRVRDAVALLALRYVVSTRAIQQGAALLRAGVPLDTVVAACVRKGMPEAEWSKVMETAK